MSPLCYPVLILLWLFFHQVPTFIYHSILRSERMTKIPTSPPTDGVTQKSEDVTSGNLKSKPNFPTKPPKSVFTLQSQTTKKKKREFAIIKLIFSSLFKARVIAFKPQMRARLGLRLE